MFFELKIRRVSLAKKKNRTQCAYQSGLNPSGGDSKKELSSSRKNTKTSERRNRRENGSAGSSVHSDVGEVTQSPTRNTAAAAAAESLQSCLTLCDPTDGCPPGSAVPGTLQARTLEWVCHFLLQCMKVKSLSRVHS